MEAGLRSNDWNMPEEHNRVMIDHISDILLAPTELARQNLLEDNVKGQIFVVGNPIVDAVIQNIEIAKRKSDILKKLDSKNDYFLLTIHREENVDHENTLQKLTDNIQNVIKKFGKRIIFPIHPRTKKRMKEYNIWWHLNNVEKLQIVDAIGYLDFLVLMINAQAVITDSGGIQEETCILKVPCITIRENTERPETVDVGGNRIVGSNLEDMVNAIKYFETAEREWENPFGSGDTAEKIVDILQDVINPSDRN